MLDNESIWVVIPVFNHPARLLETVEKAQQYGQVVVVDDCSAEPVVINDLNGASLLRHVVNRGQGAALQTGTDYAVAHGATIVVHLDADGQHDPNEIPKMIEPLVSGRVDVVFGSRFIDQANIQVPWTKKWFILKPAIFFHNLLLGVNLTDAHNGFRAMNRKALSIIHLKQDRYSHASEIVAEIAKSGLKYQEVPVTIIYNRFGQGFKGGFEILLDLFFGKFRKN